MTKSGGSGSATGGAGPRVDNVGRGIALTVIAILIFGTQDAVAKILVQDYSPFQITMMRYWAFGLFALFLVSRQAPLRRAFASKAPGIQVARALLLVGDLWLFAIANQVVPLAELQAISLVYPLVVTICAIPILGEKVGLFRFVAVGVGFLGAMIIVRPGGLPLDWGTLSAIASATFYALYICFTRKVAHRDSTATSMAYVGVIGLVLTSAVGVFFWQDMDLQGWLLTGYVMITSCVAHWLIVVALGHAPASAVQPFNYTALPWGIVLSYLVFGHLIDAISLIGAVIIVGAGLVVMARERARIRTDRAARPSRAEEEAPPH
ncbi:DMT family transporter [Arsenicitalea aurantiaca]|nr:DMT family transporter [Arsenicitalea aurantiaca]